MDNDDAPVGRILSRREVLGLLGGLGAALLVGCDSATPTATPGASAAPTATPGLNAEAATVAASTPGAVSPTAAVAAAPNCVVRPEMTEGPYFVDEKLNRADIRTDPGSGKASEGTPLALTFLVSQVAGGGCTPLKDAVVDIWHCDAAGVYSDVTSAVGQKFLRGYQATDAGGAASFTTIVPGWYQGRAVHIHFKIRTTGTNGQAYEFTSQFFFDEALLKQIYAEAPYAAKGTPDTANSRDGIYQGGGDQTTLQLTKGASGYTTTFGLALDLANATTGASDAAGGGGGPGGGPGGPPPGGGPPP